MKSTQKIRNLIELLSCKVARTVFLLLWLLLFIEPVAAEKSDANEREWPIEANINSKLQMARTEKPSKRYTRNNIKLRTPDYKAEVQDVNDLVDPNLIIMAVEVECDKRWEIYAIGEPLQCCDDNGKLVSYHVPVAINVNTFPKLLTPPPPNEITLSDIE